MDAIEDFGSQKNKQEFLPDICHGADAAMDKLKKYYSKTDDSPMNAVATALNPRMKFVWWARQKWEQHFRDQAESTIRKVWSTSYQHDTSDDATQELPPDEAIIDDEADIYGNAQVPETNELEEYISARLVKEKMHEFWQKHDKAFPHLSRMARDYLAIPATSTPSEPRNYAPEQLKLAYRADHDHKAPQSYRVESIVSHRDFEGERLYM
ncbi:hypothetical protein BGZ93_003485, partial [Podila epicladia]